MEAGWGWGRRQEARAETDVCSGLLEAEKCPLQSRALLERLQRALAAGITPAVDPATGLQGVWSIRRSIPASRRVI